MKGSDPNLSLDELWDLCTSDPTGVLDNAALPLLALEDAGRYKMLIDRALGLEIAQVCRRSSKREIYRASLETVQAAVAKLRPHWIYGSVKHCPAEALEVVDSYVKGGATKGDLQWGIRFVRTFEDAFWSNYQASPSHFLFWICKDYLSDDRTKIWDGIRNAVLWVQSDPGSEAEKFALLRGLVKSVKKEIKK